MISQLKDHATIMEPYGHVPRRPTDAMSRSDEGHIYASAKIDGCLREPSGWGFMPEVRLAPYVHDQHCSDHGVCNSCLQRSVRGSASGRGKPMFREGPPSRG